ncbi:MAG TPA: hypothetical protein VGP82_05865, partial [Ktedonobacterales bacterium]|nr:hypothetical protein [Ktedonobacterales bacterium]
MGKPYTFPADQSQLRSGPPVNPGRVDFVGGYAFTVCNTSRTAAHTSKSVAVKIEQFAPYTGTANTWQFCDGYYQRSTGAS